MGASLLALGVLASAPAHADALAADMKARIEKANPGVSVRVEGQDQLHLRKAGKSVGMMDLGNLREICEKHAANLCEEQKQRRVNLQHVLAEADEKPLAPNSVRPIVRPDSYRSAIDTQVARLGQGQSADEKRKMADSLPILNNLGRGFVHGWAEDSADGMVPISASRMKEAGLTTADLARLGSVNLKQERVEPLKPGGARHPGVFATRGNDYLPSVLVDEGFWQRVAGPQAGKDVSVCLPARHELFVHVPALDPSGRVDFAALCRQLAQNAAPMFSDRVVRRVGGQWLLN